jgi:hypothetical protein
MKKNYKITKLICIDDSDPLGICNFRIKPTYGKEYLVRYRITLSGVEYADVELMNDKGKPTGIVYRKNSFSTLEEFREKQLNKLGII